MLIVVVGFHLDDGGRVLVQQRPETSLRGGLWEYPGGKVEDGETMRGALKREWLEELKLRIEVGDLIDEQVIHFEDAGNVLLPLFRVHYSKDQVYVPQQGQTVRFMRHEKALELPGVPTMVAYARAVAAYLVEKQVYGYKSSGA